MIKLLEYVGDAEKSNIKSLYGYEDFDIPLMILDNQFFEQNGDFDHLLYQEAEEMGWSEEEIEAERERFYEETLQSYIESEQEYLVTKDLARGILHTGKFREFSNILDSLDSEVADDGWTVVYKFNEDQLNNQIEYWDASKEELEKVCREYLQALVQEAHKGRVYIPLELI